jgi:hypothetical protein
MANGKHTWEIPYCTIFLVLGALISHTLVLMGNLATARAMESLGTSTHGWSNVGLGLGGALAGELDDLLNGVGSMLSDVIAQVVVVQENIDTVLSLVGDTSDAFGVQASDGSFLQLPMNSQGLTAGEIADVTSMLQTGIAMKRSGKMQHDGEALLDSAELVDLSSTELVEQPDVPTINGVPLNREGIEELISGLRTQMFSFLDIIRPALIRIGQFLIQFGEQVQAGVEGFSTTVDRVQQLFNELMAEFTETGENKPEMIYDTYGLFDVTGTGTISVADLQNVSNIFGISAMQGQMAVDLHQTYDLDEDGELDEAEFHEFVDDERIPMSMSVVLREYSRRLSQVSGNLGAARMREEVAHSVVNYFALVCAKNMTKVGWVSDRLTNGSLPLEFTAGILRQLVRNADDPNKLTVVDVGPVVIGEMTRLQPGYVSEALELMSDPEFWVGEGFDIEDQPDIVEVATRWVTEAADAEHAAPSLRQLFGKEAAIASIKQATTEAILSAMPAAAKALTKRRVKRFKAMKLREKAQRHERLFSSHTSRMLFNELLGGRTASGGGQSPAVEAAINSGVPAVPATLEFAMWLSWNASDTADRFQESCFEYSGQSSNTLNSFANQMKSMASRISSFLDTMMEHATPRGIQELEERVVGFLDSAADEIMNAIERNSGVSFLTEARQPDASGAVAALEGSFSRITFLLTSLNDMLPTVVEDLRFARRDVSAVSQNLNSIFATFQENGPPIFYTVSNLYSMAWTAYYWLFAILTTMILFYGFWASGWFGDISGELPPGEVYEPPVGIKARCCACWSACGGCLRMCQGSAMCFWSVIIVMEVIVLVLFLVSLVLCLLAGVQAFLAAGCGQIYILGDFSICNSALDMLGTFLSSFRVGDSESRDACMAQELMTCQVIGSRMQTSAVYTVVGSLLAAVFSFQMIIETGVLYEKARWRANFGKWFPKDDEEK